MEEIKFCAICGKQIENFWVGGDVKGKEALFCGNCASEILIKKQWILEDENQALKDRWEELKKVIKADMEFNKNQPYYPRFKRFYQAERYILERMQELEKEMGNEHR